MNWKSEAIERLNCYKAMEQAVHNIPKELEILETDACTVRGARPDRVSGSCHMGPRDDILIGNIMKRQELKRTYENARLWVETTQGALSVLSPEEKLILESMYVSPERGVVNRLCSELGVEQSSVYRKRDNALYRFTMALYGES